MSALTLGEFVLVPKAQFSPPISPRAPNIIVLMRTRAKREVAPTLGGRALMHGPCVGLLLPQGVGAALLTKPPPIILVPTVVDQVRERMGFCTVCVKVILIRP